jgi:hypothetical protein
MEHEIRELAAADVTEMAAFCFRKLAALEARFIALCHRAEKLGIECSDLMGVEVTEIEPAAALRVVN